MDKKVNERQIRHLIRAMRQSQYYFGEEKRKPQIDLNFLRALQIFFLDSRGKNVRRTVNAFRTICVETFKDVPNVDFVLTGMKEKVLEFLQENLKPKAYKKAEKLLNENHEPLLYSSVPRVHPQKISELGELNFDFHFPVVEGSNRRIGIGG